MGLGFRVGLGLRAFTVQGVEFRVEGSSREFRKVKWNMKCKLGFKGIIKQNLES